MKTADELDREIWKVYQSIPTYSSNPEDYLSPIRILIQREVAAERERIKKELQIKVEKKLDECAQAACSYRTVTNQLLELIDSL
jgi:hypothetical protein